MSCIISHPEFVNPSPWCELTVFCLCGPSSVLTLESHCCIWLCWRNSGRSSGRRKPKHICVRRLKQTATNALAAGATSLCCPLNTLKPGCPLNEAHSQVWFLLKVSCCATAAARHLSPVRWGISDTWYSTSYRLAPVWQTTPLWYIHVNWKNNLCPKLGGWKTSTRQLVFEYY